MISDEEEFKESMRKERLISYSLKAIEALTTRSMIPRYLLRLSKKSNFCIFVKFAYNNVKHLEFYKLPFWGFSTISLYLTGF
jgi:hypothetical protein